MAFNVVTEPHEDHLHIALVGDWDNSGYGATADKILTSCEQHKIPKILMDVRGLSGNPNALERFSMATIFTAKYFIARLGHRIPPCRFAVIGSHPIVDPNHFEETVAVNRGLPVKTFTDLEEAMEWLEVQKVLR